MTAGQIEAGVWRLGTLNSVYEVEIGDDGATRVRRVTGKVSPTERTGTDGQWKAAEGVYTMPDASLLIQWSGVECTHTSPVVAVEKVEA